MGDKIKNNGSGFTQASEQKSFKANCSCNPYDQDVTYPPDHPPPISPPYGREDLWDLQFCRWWGWNWVRKREAEIIARYEEPQRTFPQQMPPHESESMNRPERGGGCGGNSGNQYTNNPAPSAQTCSGNISNNKYSTTPLPSVNESKYSTQSPPRRQGKGGCCDKSPPNQYPSTIPEVDSIKEGKKKPKAPKKQREEKECGRSPLPTKRQFKEMCKCLLGKRQPHGCCKMAAMANLFKTPSGSRCGMETLAYGVADRTILEQWPKCTMQKRRRGRRDLDCEDQCQHQKVPDRAVHLSHTTTNEEMISTVPLSSTSQKHCSSTGGSIEYLSVHLQHVQSDGSCPCKQHEDQCIETVAEEEIIQEQEEVQCGKRSNNRFDHQTQTHTPRDHKETQTSQSCTETVKYTKEPSQQKVLKEPSQQKVLKEPSQQKVLKIGCATEGPCTTGCKTYAEQLYNINSSKHKTLCIRVCCCGNCKPVINADGSVEHFGSSSQIKPPSNKNIKPNCCDKPDKSSTKELSAAFPIIVPPSTTKMLSKFGTPSKNYPWMQDIGSDATTTTLNNNWESYKSPASGKTYEFRSIAEFESRDSFTLPDLIDISEDLSYLKKLENSTNKSENESRLLLDAVCDAILHEHDERSLDILEELQTDSVNDALMRRYTELETLCDLTRRFHSKSDVHTELSRSYFTNEDIGINTILKSDPNDNIQRMIQSIMENMSGIQVQKSKVSTGINPEPVNVNTQPRKNYHPFEMKREDDDLFNRPLPPKRTELNKKPSKREAPNSAKKENNSKKLKHEEEKEEEEEKKVKNEEMIKDARNAGQTNERIGTIFSKIENIVKQSNVKNAEIHKMLGYKLEKEVTSEELNESLMGTVSFSPDCSSKETTKTNTSKMDNLESTSSKRIYKMSSDAFLGGISPFIAKTSEHKNMRCYDFFSDKLEELQDYSKSCSGIASQIIFEEENAKSSEDILCKSCESDHTKESVAMKSLEKLSKLSVQSFVVCDEKSSVDAKPSCSGFGAKKEKLFKKKKIASKASLIPIRKQSSDRNLNKPF